MLIGGALLALAAAALPALGQSASPAGIALAPSCGPVGAPGATAQPAYFVQVNGLNFNPFSSVLVTFDFATGGRPETFTARTDGFGHFVVTITPLQRAAGVYVVRADDLKLREATALFTVPCPPDTTTSSTTSSTTTSSTTTTTSTTTPGGGGGPPDTVPGGGGGPPAPPPTLRLEPPIGPPGFVTTAVGTGFPPNGPVALAWEPGIISEPWSKAVADAAGNFRVPVIIFHRDLLGPRELKATPTGAPASVNASFLVVPGPGQPRDFRDRR